MKPNAWQPPGWLGRQDKLTDAGAARLQPGSIQQIQAEIAFRLAECSDVPVLEAQVLLAHVLEKPRAWIIAHPEAQLDPMKVESLDAIVGRRLAGEPLPYLLGKWEFFGLEFSITPAVLIPRPETELLVEHALTWLKPARHQLGRRLHIADIGTGSGCIAVSLAVHIPGCHIAALDIARDTLEVARINVGRHQVEDRVRLIQGDLLKPFANQSFDLICANLPYIPTSALADLPVFDREPHLALDGGLDGLSLIRKLLAQARHSLARGGSLLLEIEAGQGNAVRELAHVVFPGATVSLYQDLAGKDRLVSIQT